MVAESASGPVRAVVTAETSRHEATASTLNVIQDPRVALVSRHLNAALTAIENAQGEMSPIFEAMGRASAVSTRGSHLGLLPDKNNERITELNGELRSYAGCDNIPLTLISSIHQAVQSAVDALDN